ncbi:MAG: MerR family transcriptional regulator [Nitrospiraceae bacterium]|nr:MerR family transcriptional regulator [Nitrospiraceae bacterium]
MLEMHDAQKTNQQGRIFPEKLFYKIGEASEIAGLESYVLRYWETEFSFLKPRKSRSGQRIYTVEDINLVLTIKRMLYEEKYTIDGVRRKLGNPPGSSQTQQASPSVADESSSAQKTLSQVREKLREMLQRLS